MTSGYRSGVPEAPRAVMSPRTLRTIHAHLDLKSMRHLFDEHEPDSTAEPSPVAAAAGEQSQVTY
jgi:hypothetical protein